jgi:WXG100 family type VII secretion target
VSLELAPDGTDIENEVVTQLRYLSELARHLGIVDPVEEYFAPVVGRWSDMHAEAERWRVVGQGVEQVTGELNKPLGKLDAAWDGAAADSFIAYMQRVGLAGNDLADAMIAMSEVLDQTANGIREIVVQLAGIMAETAESASQAMALPVQGDARAREYLDMMQRPTRDLFESARQILDAFVQLCEGAEGEDAFRKVTMAHTFPTENWSVPSVPAPTPGTPGGPGAPGGPGVPEDTTAADALGGFGGGGGVPGGLGGGGGGLPGGAAAASANPMGPGSFTTVGEGVPGAGAGAPAAAAASAGGTKGPGGGSMMPMAPMMGGMGAGQGGGGDSEHKSRSRVVGNPQDIFGKPAKASTPVIGADD